MLLKRTMTWLAALTLAGAGAAQVHRLPKPQIASAEGQPAPDFTLQDQSGKEFRLSALRGSRVLLIFYRGYWWPYCMTQLREFARHKKEFDDRKVQVVAVSVDDVQHGHQVWEKVTQRNFTILSDPGAKVIRNYGLLHAAGADGKDIAIRTTIFIDEQGVERWRRASETVPDIPSVNDVLQRIPPAKWRERTHMAWIKVTDDTEAGEELKQIYQAQGKKAGALANILKIHSLAPRTLSTHMAFYESVMHAPGDLSRTRREMIAVVVSGLNRCHYWLRHHGAGLLRLTRDERLVEALSTDFSQAGLEPADAVMMEYVVRLVKEPWKMASQYVDCLRQAGFSDRAILEVNLVASYMSFVNRLAQGLGVELEDYFRDFTR